METKKIESFDLEITLTKEEAEQFRKEAFSLIKFSNKLWRDHPILSEIDTKLSVFVKEPVGRHGNN